MAKFLTGAVMEGILFLIGTVAVVIGCLAPSGWLPTLPHDKFLHFIAFGILAGLAVRSTQGSKQRLVALLVVFTIGLIIELLQSLVPGRSFCWRDLLANSGGIVLAALIA